MSELSHSITRGAIGLGLFAVVTVGVVAVTQSITDERIMDNRLASQYQALGQVVPESMVGADLLDSTITLPASRALGQPDEFIAWRARKNGETQAVILPVIAHDGYSGDISLLVGIDAEGELTGVRVLSHKETPGLGDKIEVRKSDWITQFAGLSLDNPSIDQWAVKKDGGAFDAFTGATITPRAVIGAIKRSLEYFAANRAILLGEPQGDER